MVNDAKLEHAYADDELPVDLEERTERYPFIVRLFGLLSVVGAALQILAGVLAGVLIVSGRIDLTRIEALSNASGVTLVVVIILFVLTAALAVMFLILGIRLLMGYRRKAALLANIMVVLELGVGLCLVMLTGLDGNLIVPFINMVILIALQSYSDPSLLGERRLQRHLRSLENKAAHEEGTLGRDVTGRGYITLNFFNLFWIFVICCVLGLIIEVVYHVVVVEPGVYQDRAGLLYGPFSPIYGVGAVLMTVALNRFHDKNPLIIFLVSAVIGGAFEFFVSWFMETAFGIVAWDYTGTFLSIDGRTNGMFMCMWGGLGLVWIKFCLPRMLALVNRIPWNWRYAVTAVCAVLMVVDCGLTLASLDCWYQREAGTMDYEDASAIVQFCNTEYDNAFMENRFQSMSLNPENTSRV